MIANPPFFLQEQRRANTLQPPVRDKSLAVCRKEKPKEFLVQSTRTRTARCHLLGLCAPGLSPGMPRAELCSPARMSASSMNWVLNRITRPARCSRRRLHTWCLERGSSPAVGSSRSKTCRRDGKDIPHCWSVFGVWCSEGKRPRASFRQGCLF